MKNRESLKSKLQNTDDEALKKMIVAVASASGMSEARKNALIADIPGLRRMLNKTDEGQLSAIISSFEKQGIAEAIKKIREENK